MNTKRLTVQRALWTAQGEPIPVGEAAVAVAFGTCQSPKWLCMEWALQVCCA